jgi:hypothetical protein
MSQHNVTSVSVCGGQSKLLKEKKQSSVARILDPINTWILFWSRIMEAVSFTQYLPDSIQQHQRSLHENLQCDLKLGSFFQMFIDKYKCKCYTTAVF